MAGYVKVWTSIKSNPEFLSLSLVQRGAWYELLVGTKNQRDDGMVFYRNQSAMGMDWGCEGKTAGKVLGILQEKSLLTYTKNSEGGIAIKIANYKKWQDLTVGELVENSRKNPRKIPSLRPDQTKPEQTIPYREVVEHLNLLSGKAYRHTSGNTKRFIRVRWNEGFRLDDFIYVNQVKAEQWLGTEREKYLRPETLYGNKMEGYRQERRIPRQYSEKTNKALIAAAKYLKQESFEVESSGQAQISSNDA